MAINSDQKRKNVRRPSAGRRSGGRSVRKPERKAAQNSGQRAAQRSERCPVVGLGGSAGGIDAFQAFFDQVPDEPGFAFVVVLHLSPDTQSHLSEVLRPHTGMPVEAVSEPVALRPNHVYVVQPNTILTLDLTPFLVRASCDLSGWFQLICELSRRQAAKARMGSIMIIIRPPIFNAQTRVSHGQEP